MNRIGQDPNTGDQFARHPETSQNRTFTSSVIKWKKWSSFRTVLYEKVSSIWTANQKPDVLDAIWKSATWNPDTLAIQIPDSSGIQIVVTVVIFFAQIWHFLLKFVIFCSTLTFFAQLWLNLRLWTVTL